MQKSLDSSLRNVNAEKYRSALGGLAIDKRETNVIHNLDKLSRDEIVARLSELRKNYPSAFIDGDFKVVEERKGKVSLQPGQIAIPDIAPCNSRII